MKLVALFSGGKDSTFAIHKVRKMGHDVRCLLTIMTLSENSHLLHHPNILATKLQAQSMGMPQILLESKSDNTQDELDLLKWGLEQAKKDAAASIEMQRQKVMSYGGLAMLGMVLVVAFFIYRGYSKQKKANIAIVQARSPEQRKTGIGKAVAEYIAG